MDASPALRSLFHPIDPAEIAEAMVSERRLFCRTERSAAFAQLLPWETLGTLVTAEALRSGQAIIARQGRPLPLEMVGAGSGGLAPEAIQALCDQGASLVLNSVEKQVPAIAAMNAMVERYLRCNTHSNAYASFNRESAFKAHFDGHHVLILQLQGRKHWWCYGQTTRFPMQGKTFSSPADLPATEWEGVLEPGDMLFVPRGDVHRAMVEGSTSLHLTVTLSPPTGTDAMAWFGRRLLDEDIGRQYLPVLGSPEQRSAHQAALRATLHQLIDSFEIDGFLAQADADRAPFRPFSLGLGQQIESGLLVQLAFRRRVSPDVVQARHGPLGEPERAVLALLFAEDALSVGDITGTLPAIDAHAAIKELARKALIFLSSSD